LAQKAATRTRTEPRTHSGADAITDAKAGTSTRADSNTCTCAESDSNACTCADTDPNTSACADTNSRAGSFVERQPSDLRRGRRRYVRPRSDAAERRSQGRSVRRRFGWRGAAIGHEPVTERHSFGGLGQRKPGRRRSVHLLRTKHLSFSALMRFRL